MQTNLKPKKITLTTVKAFIRRYRDELLMMGLGGFDGQADGWVDNEAPSFVRVDEIDDGESFDVWFARSFNVHRKPAYSAYCEGGFVGFSIFTRQFSVVLAVPSGVVQAAALTACLRSAPVHVAAPRSRL